MIYSDSFIEKNSLYLRNLVTNDLNVSTGTWTSALTGYGFYGLPYETKLSPFRYYYQRCVYKFTTTNQKPTWCTMYLAGGYQGGATINNSSGLTPNTEYTLSAIIQLVRSTNRSNSSGTIYNGASSAINGVSSYVKDVLVYDITALYAILKTKGTVTDTNSLKSWCDANLAHKPRYTNYNISSLITDSSKKVFVNKGSMISGEFIETDGMQYYSTNSTVANNTYFDSASGVSVYNNSGGGTVTHTRVTDTTSPFYPEHKYVLKIVTNGTASPGTGGFQSPHNAKANGIFIEKFVAKIPVGYTVNAHYNPQGDGASITYLTSREGTGKWQEYAILYKCGSTGTFSSGGHVALSGSNNTSVTWYVAYVNNCDITGKEYLKGYTVLPSKECIASNKVFSRKLDESNLFPNGNGGILETSMLPSGWSYDTSDVAGNAKASIVQPVGAPAGVFGSYVNINPYCRYKLSMWIKCKKDMTSFLVTIYPYTASGRQLTCTDVSYVTGTKTKLTANLVSGATSMKVSSNANWVSRNYSRIGFRSGTEVSYNDIGVSNSNSQTGMISGISGSDTVTFKIAYSGETRAANTYVVESFDGATYPYPIQKDSLPTDNTWKYLEGYFGGIDQIWDGSGGNWSAIPFDCSKITLGLNLYSNNGTVPIKYADIRLEAIGGSGSSRWENKIQLCK